MQMICDANPLESEGGGGFPRDEGTANRYMCCVPLIVRRVIILR